MTAEMILLLCLYGMFVIGIFLKEKEGLYYSFQGTLPYLSARVQKHTATGAGFFGLDRAGGMSWDEP